MSVAIANANVKGKRIFSTASHEYLLDRALEFGWKPQSTIFIDANDEHYEESWVADLPEYVAVGDWNLWIVRTAEDSQNFVEALKLYRKTLFTLQKVLPSPRKFLRGNVNIEDLALERLNAKAQGQPEIVEFENFLPQLPKILDIIRAEYPDVDMIDESLWRMYVKQAQGSAIRIVDRMIRTCMAGECYFTFVPED